MDVNSAKIFILKLQYRYQFTVKMLKTYGNANFQFKKLYVAWSTLQLVIPVYNRNWVVQAVEIY